MTRYLKTALLAAAALLASCIHNDIPYPVVELRIASVEGQGFSVSENNVTSRTVTLSLDEATDIRNVRIDAVGYDAVIHSIQLDKEEVLQQIRSSRELTGTFDLRSPIYTTLSLYQDYEWTIRATQTIERRFSVTGQIGATEIEEKNRIARVLVPSDTDLAHIEVTELKLGPADITTYSPSLEELSGSSFESVRFVDVTCHGITERWLLYVEPTNVKVALRATDLWNNTATATALVSAEEYAAGAALEYRIKGATEWQRMAESSYEAGILTATLAPEWSSSTNPHGLAVYNFVGFTLNSQENILLTLLTEHIGQESDCSGGVLAVLADEGAHPAIQRARENQRSIAVRICGAIDCNIVAVRIFAGGQDCIRFLHSAPLTQK